LRVRGSGEEDGLGDGLDITVAGDEATGVLAARSVPAGAVTKTRTEAT
jgi:hypothetical protein